MHKCGFDIRQTDHKLLDAAKVFNLGVIEGHEVYDQQTSGLRLPISTLIGAPEPCLRLMPGVAGRPIRQIVRSGWQKAVGPSATVKDRRLKEPLKTLCTANPSDKRPIDAAHGRVWYRDAEKGGFHENSGDRCHGQGRFSVDRKADGDDAASAY